MLRKFFYKDMLSSPSSLLLQALLLLATTSFAVIFVISWPAFIAYEEQATRTVSWDIRAGGFLTGDIVAALASSLDDHETAKVALELHSAFAIEAVNGDEEHAAANSTLECLFLYPNEWGLYPIDVFTAPFTVVEGDAYAGDGFIVSGDYAQSHKLRVGDELSVVWGLWVSETDIRYLTYSMKISAIVAPDSHFNNTAAAMMPQDLLVWWSEQDEEFVVTDILFLGIQKDDVPSAVRDIRACLEFFTSDGVESAESDHTVYTEKWGPIGISLGDDLRQRYQDALLQDNGMNRYAIVSAVAASAILLITALAAGVLKYQRRKGGYAILEAYGMSVRRLAWASFAEAAITYAIFGTCGFFLGRYLSRILYGSWIPIWLDAIVFTGIIAVYLLAALVQVWVITMGLKPELLHRVLIEEG